MERLSKINLKMSEFTKFNFKKKTSLQKNAIEKVKRITQDS